MPNNPVTLAEVALTTKDVVLEKFVKNLIRKSPAMGSVPFVQRNLMSIVNKKWKTLPAGQRRNINEGYTQVKGTTKDESWEPRFYGGDVMIDSQLVDLDNAIESEASLQTKMTIAGIASDWTSDFIAGDPTVNAKSMFGLKYLATNYQNSKMVIGVNATTTALDVTASAANAHTLNNALQKAIAYVQDTGQGGKICIYCNQATRLGISAALRFLNLLDQTKDQFGRMFTTFAGAPIYDVGLQSDQSTEIITTAETDDGITGTGTTGGTSIYVVRWDATDGAIGIQKGTPRIYDPLKGGEMESQPAKLLRCDWGTMIIPRSDFCIARIYGIRNPAGWTVKP